MSTQNKTERRGEAGGRAEGDGYVFSALSGPPAPPVSPRHQEESTAQRLRREQEQSRAEAAGAAPHPPKRHVRRTGGPGRVMVWLLVLALALAAGWYLRGALAPARPQDTLSEAPLDGGDEAEGIDGTIDEPKTQPADADGPADPTLWSLMLANTQHPLPDGYVPPQLAEMDKEGRQLDARIAGPFREMVAAAEKDGCHLVLTSGYRSEERQKELYVQMLRDYLSMGYGAAGAWDATKSLRNIPGTSEHQTGLAADIVSAGYWTLDEGYADTAEAKWLVKHAAEYGFILRYPKDKTEITGTSYEPWHYRYVGVEDAKKIMARGITLEEYLGEA